MLKFFIISCSISRRRLSTRPRPRSPVGLGLSTVRVVKYWQVRPPRPARGPEWRVMRKMHACNSTHIARRAVICLVAMVDSEWERSGLSAHHAVLQRKLRRYPHALSVRACQLSGSLRCEEEEVTAREKNFQTLLYILQTKKFKPWVKPFRVTG